MAIFPRKSLWTCVARFSNSKTPSTPWSISSTGFPRKSRASPAKSARKAFSAANLTDQVRGIVKVVTAVADGNLRQKLTVEAKGEVAALAETINNMTDTLAIFADQVTTVAREVGVEGRLGGQAHVPGAAGTWKDLTGNVNLLADNLTNQVRAIAEVATAVTKGDLTRSIQVEASGEVAELKDNINTMINNLRDTTQRNAEQDWL